MKKTIFLLTLILLSIFLVQNVLALCDSGQVDINSASVQDLDSLDGIGPVKAQEIVDSRPFGTLDDLLNVSGIGNVTLNKIKTQGLACVSGEKESIPKKETTNKSVNANSSQNNSSKSGNILGNNETVINNYSKNEPEIIQLNYPANYTKDIKTAENSEISGDKENKIPMYGFFVFSVLIGVLLIVKRRKKQKNDFE